MRKLFCFLCLLFSSTAFAGPVNNIVFFGDSLTDNGNLYNFFSKHFFYPFPKSPPYFQGHFSNGLTWADDVSNELAKNHITSVNYAYGGATAVFRSPTKGALPWNLAAEMESYFYNDTSTDRSHTLYIIWMGSNDYLDETNQDVDSLTTDVVNKISEDVAWFMDKDLARIKDKDKSAQNFVLIGIPNLAKTPYAYEHELLKPGTAKRLEALSLLNNKKLNAAITALKQSHPGATITYLDTFDVLTDVVNNPEKINQQYHLNMKNVTQSCWQGGYTFKRFDQRRELSGELQKSLQDNHQDVLANANSEAVASYMLSSPSTAEAYSLAKAYENGTEKPCLNEDEYAFWDKLHPTRVLHQVLANITLQHLNAAGFIS